MLSDLSLISDPISDLSLYYYDETSRRIILTLCLRTLKVVHSYCLGINQVIHRWYINCKTGLHPNYAHIPTDLTEIVSL